ncbi:MAG: alpha/beta hydrolase, partial [Pseudomonadota bacterium]
MEPAPFLGPAPGGLAADETWWITASDGTRLRAGLWHAQDARAHCLFLTGRTEYIEKASIPAADLVQRGYSVISLDWRGQGLSARATDNPLKGHVGDFDEFQRDLDALLATPQAKALPGARLLMCHSMGGLIGAAALQR